MGSAPLPADETERLAALRRLGILDTAPEDRYDRLTRLTAALLDVPMALISLVDEDRQWFKSKIGLADDETSRDVAFCSHAVANAHGASSMVVPDAALDDRFADNPLVTEDPNVRFYAGQVLHSPDGHAIGTLCVLDTKPRDLDPLQAQALADIAAIVELELGHHRHVDTLVQLEQSERVKTAILDTMEEGVVLLGPDGCIADWNPAAERLLGLDAAAMQAFDPSVDEAGSIRPDGSPMAPAERPGLVTLETGQPVTNQVMGYHRPDGQRVWLRVSSRQASTTDGAIGVLVVFVDITAETELEERLRTAEESARISLDSLTQGVILTDGKGGVRRLNPAAEHILGYTAEQLERRWAAGTWKTFDEDGRELEIHERPIVRAMRGEVVDGQVIGWYRRDGRRVLLRVSCAPTGHADGSMLIAFLDVTREQQLARDIARFQHLFHHANDIVTVIDRDGRVQYSSPSGERVLGYRDGNRHPDGILGLVHPDDLEGAVAELHALIAGTRGPEPFTVRVRAASGDWRHLECVGANLLDEPAIRGLVLTSRDITERQQLTEQLAFLAEHDPLTGLRNRSRLVPALERDLARSARTSAAHTAVCFIDLDHFKAVNDTHGHATGDDVLRTVGARIETAVRAGDTAVRIGGDEFVVVMHPVASTEDAVAIARRLRAALIDDPIVVGDLTVGASIGVAVNVDGEEAADLLARADAALYEAKAAKPSALIVG